MITRVEIPPYVRRVRRLLLHPNLGDSFHLNTYHKGGILHAIVFAAIGPILPTSCQARLIRGRCFPAKMKVGVHSGIAACRRAGAEEKNKSPTDCPSHLEPWSTHNFYGQDHWSGHAGSWAREMALQEMNLAALCFEATPHPSRRYQHLSR